MHSLSDCELLVDNIGASERGEAHQRTALQSGLMNAYIDICMGI